MDEDVKEGKKTEEIKINPHHGTKEEVNKRKIAEIKDSMDIDDTEIKEIPEIDEGSSSEEESSSDEDSSSDDDSISEEHVQEIIEIEKKLDDMITAGNYDEAVGMYQMRKLIKLPISVGILHETTIARTVGRFERRCKTKAVSDMVDSLSDNWQKIFPDKSAKETNPVEQNTDANLNATSEPTVSVNKPEVTDKASGISERNSTHMVEEVN